MSHSREVKPHAYEIKFVVPSEVANEIRRWARVELEPDPHGAGPHRDEYRTTSLYLDNLTLDVFHRRGSMGRSKYRIRRYGDGTQVFLERKMRRPAVLAKRRTIVPLSALGHLLPSLEPLLPSFARGRAVTDASWSGRWFHRRIVARGLRPVCQVSYFRMARGVFSAREALRLTLDSDLRARPAHGYAFEPEPGLPIAGPLEGGAAILELKYRGPAPAVFKRLVQEFALVPQAASKYRMGMLAAMPVPAGPIPPRYLATEFHA